ncbi:hypothetical protein CkaCkLH20_12801 [Colletotrichum karsti]|uniref:Uncharacterized protein n=1 Tax=Colletotrichum karsti TaxID=1095194 RepID=A0A9P6LDZ0_9PEZI|nr:uncharacterized protein CkaCkLH20_12801 [Colletotrichum karsti]KAF9869758.1 hypothetical protein CkaCkLH20_12801 [Colletotrichum karsti]
MGFMAWYMRLVRRIDDVWGMAGLDDRPTRPSYQVFYLDSPETSQGYYPQSTGVLPSVTSQAYYPQSMDGPPTQVDTYGALKTDKSMNIPGSWYEDEPSKYMYDLEAGGPEETFRHVNRPAFSDSDGRTAIWASSVTNMPPHQSNRGHGQYLSPDTAAANISGPFIKCAVHEGSWQGNPTCGCMVSLGFHPPKPHVASTIRPQDSISSAGHSRTSYCQVGTQIQRGKSLEQEHKERSVVKDRTPIQRGKSLEQKHNESSVVEDRISIRRGKSFEQWHNEG